MLTTCFGGDLESPKIENRKNVCAEVWTFSKIESNSISKQKSILKLFIALKMSYICCHYKLFVR